MKYNTFRFLCEWLGPYLNSHETHFKVVVLVQVMIAMSFHRLGSGDGVQNIANFCGIHNNILSKTVIRFYILILLSPKIVSGHSCGGFKFSY